MLLVLVFTDHFYQVFHVSLSLLHSYKYICPSLSLPSILLFLLHSPFLIPVEFNEKNGYIACTWFWLSSMQFWNKCMHSWISH
jgi:hypothetical protein